MKQCLLLLICLLCEISQAECFADASRRYGIAEDLLRAIAKVESGGNAAAMNMSHVQKTKSYDIGLMQINSSWLPKLKGMNISEDMLRDGCQNVMVGAWILSHHMREAGANWNGVGAYNASCRTKTQEECRAARNAYAWKVYRAWTQNEKNKVHQKPSSSMEPVTTQIDPKPQAVSERAQRAIRTVEVATNALKGREFEMKSMSDFVEIDDEQSEKGEMSSYEYDE